MEVYNNLELLHKLVFEGNHRECMRVNKFGRQSVCCRHNHNHIIIGSP